MKLKNFLNAFFAFSLSVCLVACGGDNNDPDPAPKPDPTPTPTTGDPVLADLTESQINGTTINASTTVAGLIKDSKTGKGIKGIPVTDGYSYTVTDDNGVYQMARASKSRKVYYTTPAEYEVYLDSKYSLPCFFSPGTFSSSKKYRVDFTLTPLAAVEDDFTLIAMGDPQCSVADEARRYSNETIKDIVSVSGSYKNVYAVTLGDITFDSANLWSTMRASMSNVKAGGRTLPFFQCIGNHDHNSLMDDTGNDEDDDYRATLKYEETFGPTDYSFDRGKAHIIVMDDIMVTSKTTSSKYNEYTWEYNGGG